MEEVDATRSPRYIAGTEPRGQMASGGVWNESACSACEGSWRCMDDDAWVSGRRGRMH